MDLLFAVVTRLVLAGGLLLMWVMPASAQNRLVEPPPGPDILTRADFHLGLAALGSGDERFGWDSHWGGEFDLLDYVAGRVTFYADYQAVLGSQLQPFDPNQGNYTLTVSNAWRVKSAEIAVVFHHLSRHLGDRPKTFGIAMNVLGVRLLKDVSRGNTRVELRGDAGGVIQNAYIDYTWVAGLDVKAIRRLNSRVDGYLRLDGELTGVDEQIANRSTQQGGGLEAGVRISVRGGFLEFFAGYARVVDADPLDRQAQRWAFGGFRLLSH
jgi:hypothetical protein